MTNLFLKVNKDLFTMGLTPIEILIVAQIMEFNINTGDCYVSDEQFAEMFGVSKSTVSRSIKALEGKGLIQRTTKNTHKGKERHLTFIEPKEEVKEADCGSANVNLTVANSQTQNSANVNLTVAHKSICLLRKKQNESIKDNIEEDKEKDKCGNRSCFASSTTSISEMEEFVF